MRYFRCGGSSRARSADDPGQVHGRSGVRCRERRRPHLRHVRGAPRALRVHGHLRARSSDRGRARVPWRRPRARARARRHRRPVSGRQLRLRLRLGGRHRPARGATGQARPRLAVDRDESFRHGRVRALVLGRPRRADARSEPRDARSRGGARARRVLQPSGRHVAVGSSGAERPSGAARHPAVVPRQRARRALADRAEDRVRVRPPGCRGGEGDEAGRPDDRAHCLRQLGARDADLRVMGGHGAGAVLRRRRLRLAPRLLRPRGRRRRQLPRELGRHAGVHLQRRRDVRLRAREGAERQADSTFPSTNGTSGTSPASATSRGASGRSIRVSSRTSTPSRTPSSSAASSSPCSGTRTA